MPAGWDIADGQLQEILGRYRSGYLNGENLDIHLYKNDYTPVPGSDVGDYTEADFTGYLSQVITGGTWGSVTVADHIAVTVNADTFNFTYTAGGGSPQTIYGYYITGDGGDYFWGERFSEPRVMNPADELNITPELRVRVYPA